jgi:putative ATPase
MRDLEYGRGYQYAHEVDDRIVTHIHFPESLGEPVLYHPSGEGREAAIAAKLSLWRESRRLKRKEEGSGGTLD